MKKEILIVDDSESIREIISSGLREAGYDVFAASIGAEGVQTLAARDSFHLVITDLNMPVMDGMSFLKEIRKNHASQYTPVLILTTESQEAIKMKAKEAGATAWLTKPFSQEKLIQIVRKIIG